MKRRLPAVCTGTSDRTFALVLDATGAQFEGNELADDQSLEPGEARACTVTYVTAGMCAPCSVDIGRCGEQLLDFALRSE